ncbi:MAG: hypothetical protein BroJett030_18300 [Alphaproteobacteria bacterium]|nr:MAG: hypothetical protein BroJett030_18300 [Alphaproteobacteria bacterium]
MPFTVEDFLAVFARYNEAIWPLQILAYLTGAGIVALLARPGRGSAAAITLALAGLWAVNAVGYHWHFFSAINPLARLFGALFLIQAGLLAACAVWARDLRFAFVADARGIAGAALIAFAVVVYPLWGWAAGHHYPAVPMFGVAPCPTTIFTIGVLVMGTWRIVRFLLVVPVLWSAVGGSAAVLLGVPQDHGLAVSGLIAVALAIGHWLGVRFAVRLR